MKWERGKESAAVSSAGNCHERWENLCLHPDRTDKGMRETPLCLRMLHTSQSEYANAHGFLGSHMHLCLYLELGKMLPRSRVKKLNARSSILHVLSPSKPSGWRAGSAARHSALGCLSPGGAAASSPAAAIWGADPVARGTAPPAPQQPSAPAALSPLLVFLQRSDSDTEQSVPPLS